MNRADKEQALTILEALVFYDEEYKAIGTHEKLVTELSCAKKVKAFIVNRRKNRSDPLASPART